MATVVKDFKIKSGLVVEGANATVNGFDILTKKQLDQDYIVSLIGGTATSENTPDTVVKRDGNGDFAAGTVSVNRISIGGVGYIEDDGSIEIVNTDGDDINITADDIRLRAADDVQITSGTDGSPSGDISLTTNGGNIRFQSEDVYLGTNIGFTDAERVATRGYADQAEADAVSSANSYTNTALEDYTPTSSLDATVGGYGYLKSADLTGYATEEYANSAADQAEADAISTAASDATTKANAAEAAAKLYADGLAVNYDAAGSAAAALADANDYTDTAVANLVDGAPALLDTLNELAAAIADNPNYATDVANLVATKADTSYVDQEIADAIAATTYTAGDNIDITSNVISVVNLVAADLSDFDSAAVSANTGLWDNLGAAATAETNAKSYADGLAVNYDPAGSAATAESNANTFTTSSINALDTDDIEEGVTNLYFTNGRAQAAVSGDIESAVNDVNATINALTTDDIAEGANLYFTDSRAVDALEAVVPNFEAVEIDSVAKQVAATLSAPTAGIQSAYSWTAVDYRSAEFLVKVAYGTHTEVSKVLLTLDTSDNIAITEYGIVGTNGSASSISASVSAGSVSLDVTTTNNNSTVTVVGTLLA